MKYYIIAGEASGDLHGSNLIIELKRQDPSADVRCWGGDLMRTAGGDLVKHYKDLAFMGFVEVVKHLNTIFKNLSFCKDDIQAFAPDVLVLIDYPGFNLRIAEWAKAKGYKVVYYIAPQVWAWKENRVPKMRKSVDALLTILPFEKQYFQDNWNWSVEYVGHPLVDAIDKYRDTHQKEILPKPIIALLPGSRKQEIAKKLPVMLQVATSFPDYQFVVSKAPGLETSLYDAYLAGCSNVILSDRESYYLMQNATAALVTSGTATLETALFGTPEVVCYKGSQISYQIAKRLIKIKYISLVNLIMDELVVTELIQDQMTAENCILELRKILDDSEYRNRMIQYYADLRRKLQDGGHASQNAAQIITQIAGV